MRLKVRLGSAEMARVCRLSNQITAMDEQNAYFNDNTKPVHIFHGHTLLMQQTGGTLRNNAT